MEEKGPCEINVLILYHGRVTVYRFMMVMGQLWVLEPKKESQFECSLRSQPSVRIVTLMKGAERLGDSRLLGITEA